PPFEQLEPVGAGVFDFLFTSGAYHVGTTPLLIVTDALVGTAEDAREPGGVFDFIDEHYQQLGVKLLMLPITPPGAYHMISRSPIGEEGNLEGKKIRGSLSYQGVVEGLDASLVVIPASEIYTALEKGVVDGASWPVIGALDYRWYEVADFLIRPAFGTNSEPIFMNLDAWMSLSDEDQDTLLEIAMEIEKEWYERSPKIWAEEEEKLLEKGMEITEMGEKQKEKLQQFW